MPVVDKGVRICEKCNKSFDWVYFTIGRTKIGEGVPTCEEIPVSDIPRVYAYSPTDDGRIHIKVNCSHCGWDNHFYTYNDKSTIGAGSPTMHGHTYMCAHCHALHKPGADQLPRCPKCGWGRWVY